MKPGTINADLEAKTREHADELRYRRQILVALEEKLKSLQHGHSFGVDRMCHCGTTLLQYANNPELCPLAHWQYQESLTGVSFRLERP